MIQFRAIMRSYNPDGTVVEAIVGGDWQDCTKLNKIIMSGTLFSEGTILQRKHPDGEIFESMIHLEEDFNKWAGNDFIL